MTGCSRFPADPGLDELFLRYWDNVLTDAEAAELDRRLRADAAARDRFRELVTQAVVLGECLAPARPPVPPPQWSRRKILGWSGLAFGVAVSVAATARYWAGGEAAAPARAATLTTASGVVWIRGGGDDRSASTGQGVRPGETVGTEGPNSSARLTYPDGSFVILTGDTVATLPELGRGLRLLGGAATADIRLQPAGTDPLTMVSERVTLPGLSGAAVTLGEAARATEVVVHQGLVTALASTGERIALVRGGEVLTVRADGNHQTLPIPATPSRFAWDLSRPLPEGWRVGHREATAEGPVVRADFWFNPYHKAVLSEIRSDKKWTRGFFQLTPGAEIRVRYRVARPGRGLVGFCVRTPDTRSPATGMLEWNGVFTPAPGEGWQSLVFRAADMLDNDNRPKFGPPWVGFLVILHTYTADLGLSVAEFRVTGPEAVVPGVD